jgi:putative endonuclease
MRSSQNKGIPRRELGQLGEDAAADYLERQGYVILARNWRCPAGEIDLVTQDAEALVFVEVRARRGDRFGTPEESVTPDKQARLLELAQTYLQEAGLGDQNWRIDVVAIDMDWRGRIKRLNLIRNAIWGQ